MCKAKAVVFNKVRKDIAHARLMVQEVNNLTNACTILMNLQTVFLKLKADLNVRLTLEESMTVISANTKLVDEQIEYLKKELNINKVLNTAKKQMQQLSATSKTLATHADDMMVDLDQEELDTSNYGALDVQLDDYCAQASTILRQVAPAFPAPLSEVQPENFTYLIEETQRPNLQTMLPDFISELLV
jgi:hypothetical protein